MTQLRPVPGAPLLHPVPGCYRPLTFPPGPWGGANSQLTLASGWEGGPAGCRGRPCAQRTFCATVPRPGRPRPPATSRALAGQGWRPLLSTSSSADHGGHPPPPGPGNRSLQYKCKFTGVPSLRLAAPACTAGWGHELTLAQRR